MVDVSKLRPIDQISDNDDESRGLKGLAQEATQYLSSFPWCKRIVRGWLGAGVAGIYGVFLFELKPQSEKVDSWLWVIVGDLPPAYLVTDDSPMPSDALRNYVDLMEEWVEKVRAGESTEDCIPVNAEATHRNADALQGRIGFLRAKILS